MKPPMKRCAIYTRKSSDEGLDQAFNSLDAQREAGKAYIASQASEGWRVVKTVYDDGGFSGGSMERPALRRLMADVEAGLIDVVVVYKIDRLTRSLADFARIVECVDATNVSFVSVTQAFNTTSSMGRLTLNVMLSFAQFEREVTGERIRDKIAASKAKGMWMGGIPPLGYDLPIAGSRMLRVNEAEAATVRAIFARYLELGSVHKLAIDLARQDVRSKARVTQGGKATGGLPFNRGALFHLLRNRIYLGHIVHGGAVVHENAHPAIVTQAIFDDVQQAIDGRRRRHAIEVEQRVTKAPLTGKLFDASGEAMSPAFSHGRANRVYRYYVLAAIQAGRAKRMDGTVQRIAAPAIEQFVQATMVRLLPGAEQPFADLFAVHLRRGGIELILPRRVARMLERQLGPGDVIHPADAASEVALFVPIVLPLRGGRRTISAGTPCGSYRDPVLIAALRKAHAMITRDPTGRPLVTTAPASSYERKLLRLAFLAPQIQADILAGRQPPRLTLEQLMRQAIPDGWDEQRVVLGWAG